MRVFEKNRKRLIYYFGRLEVNLRVFFYGGKPDYDDIIDNAKEIIKTATFMKSYNKINEVKKI